VGLAQTQHILARLYTNATLRERFFRDPEHVGQEWGLTPDEVRHMAELSRQQVNHFAASLMHKRCNEVVKLLPLTHRVLGETFTCLFREYAGVYVPCGTHKHHDDALAFAAYVAHDRAAPGIPPWLLDLARYEAGWLKAKESTCRILLRHFRYHVGEIVDRLARGDAITACPRQPTVALWYRSGRRGPVRHVVLAVPRRHFGNAQDQD